MNLVALLMADSTPRSPLTALYAPLRAFPAVGKGAGKAQSLQAILAPLKACHAPLPHRLPTTRGSLGCIFTHNTYKRWGLNKDQKNGGPEGETGKPESQETKKGK
jgi:hypothetical protein